MKMLDIDANERPREKMLARGVQGMSDGELLSVLIRNGHGDKNALDLSRTLLESGGGGLTALFNMPLNRLLEIPGVGPCKAASLMAAFELGRRFLEEKSSVSNKPVLTSRMVYSLMAPTMKGLSHEECWLLFLNNANYLLSRIQISKGGLDSTPIDLREAVRLALENNATGVILVHNHPSGNPNPSKADVEQTSRMKKALQAFSIDLVDHVVISDDCFFSFAEDRLYGK